VQWEFVFKTNLTTNITKLARTVSRKGAEAQRVAAVSNRRKGDSTRTCLRGQGKSVGSQ